MNETERVIDVLLVEDEEADVALVIRAFNKAKLKYSVHICKNGDEAVKYLRRQPPFENVALPDMIIMDINMPHTNGFEALKEIKEDPSLRRIPIAILTGSDAITDVNKSYDLYANCYIKKPSESGDVVKLISLIEGFWFSTVSLPE